MSTNYQICVVGAGVIGLSTAVELQRILPDAQVTIIADKFLTDTTSHVAAGIFRPSLNFSGPNTDITLEWLHDSYSYYSNIIRKFGPEVAKDIGVRTTKAVIISTKSEEAVRNFYLEKILSDYRVLSEREIEERFGKGQRKYVSTFTTVVVECRKYLPYLLKWFQNQGGKAVKSSVTSFEELGDKFDLIFNCTGLGSQYLCKDFSLTPIRGQVYKVKAPWIKEAIYFDTDTYIIPGLDGIVTLGGTRQFESTNLDVDKHDAAAIWERCTAVDKTLWNAKIIQECVGLRPYRPQVRVEKEKIKFPSGKCAQVIHNYGHGGYGVTSAPGTSKYAVSLGLEILGEKKLSKL